MAAARHSAGILLYRRGAAAGGTEVLLAHMGGPFWARRDAGAWSVPKGELETGEEPLAAARREFEEELGQPPPAGEVTALGSVRQASGKLVTAFAVEGDLDVGSVRSNMVELEWPRGSGRTIRFPEVDRVAWFGIPQAREKVVKGQGELFDRLAAALGDRQSGTEGRSGADP